jgi:hypothetical protein
MISRRAMGAMWIAGLWAAGPLERLDGKWRTRFVVVRAGRALYSRARFLFEKGSFVLEEYATGGQLAWVYRGTARVNGEAEMFLEVASVTDAAGTAAEPGRARYEAGESYNLGAVEFLSAARVRVGALELQKELE